MRCSGGVPTVRQLVPAGLILALAGSALLAWLAPGPGRIALAGIAGVYLLGVLAATLRTWWRTRRPAAFLLPLVFPVLHGAYGWGYLCGLLPALRAGAPGRLADVALTR